MVRAELRTARGLGEQLLRLAQRQDDPALLLEAHYSLGNTLFWRRELAAAQTHLEHTLALYPPEPCRSLLVCSGTDPAVGSRSTMALTLWLLGYPDQALECIHAALTLARELAHSFSLALALNYAAGLHIVRGEGHLAHECAEATIVLATEQGFPHWQAGGAILQGWTLA
jgi:adenylate cyclase